MEQLEIRVFGRVQGVAFRWYTQRQATALGLTGWVRNQADGSVRMVAEGERETLQALLAWTGRGPDLARVDRTEFCWSEATESFAEFLITG